MPSQLKKLINYYHKDVEEQYKPGWLLGFVQDYFYQDMNWVFYRAAPRILQRSKDYVKDV
jgi:hypothetical protein